MPLPQLTAEAIAPYATVLKGEPGKPVSVPEVMDKTDLPGRHALTILSPQPVDSGTVRITALEKHPNSAQTFVPIKAGRWLVLVAPTLPDGSPDMTAAKAFLAGPENAICIGRDVWHAGLTVFDRPAEFAMIMWQTQSGEDGVLHELSEPTTLSID